jgi:hypothetical protein
MILDNIYNSTFLIIINSLVESMSLNKSSSGLSFDKACSYI